MNTLFSTQASDVLWKISAQTAVVAAAVWLISRLAARAPARVRHALWILVVLKFLVPPFAYLPFGLALQQPEHATWSKTTVTMVSGSAGDIDSTVTANGPKPSPAPAYHSPVATTSSWLPSVTDLFLIAWLIGMALMVVGLLVRQVRQELLVRTSQPAGSDMVDLLKTCAEMSRVVPVPRLRVSGSAATPILIGFLQPMIVLPMWASDPGNLQHLEAILLHELAHVRHRDMLWLWLYQLVKIPFFFHPGLWLAGYQMSREREFACDEFVVSSTGVTPKDYAAGYVEALKMSNAVNSMPVCVAMAEPFEVERTRVERILHRPVPKLNARWVAALVVVAALAIPTFAGSSRPAGEGTTDRQLVLAGLTEMQGPGIIVTLRDKPGVKQEDVSDLQYLVHDPDIRDFVNALFAAGAEAVSINGQRYVTTTAIRVAGPTVQINRIPLGEPFTIKAIGDPDRLERSLNWKRGPIDRLPGGMVSLRRESRIVVEPLQRSSLTDDELAYLTGSTEVVGPGVTVTLRDSLRKVASNDRFGPMAYIIHDIDIKDTINELKAAGAVAISVNGNRLVATSFIANAGPMIVVDGQTVPAPFEIRAIGDPETLDQALNVRGGLVERFPDKAMIGVRREKRFVVRPYTATRLFLRAKPAGQAGSKPATSQPKQVSDSGSMLSDTRAGLDVPSIDYLSAALVDQLTRANGSVVADYTYSPDPNAGDGASMSFHYVRTAESLRLEEMGTDKAQRMVDSFDRGSGEFRQLQVGKAGRCMGLVTKTAAGMFSIQATIDPIYRWIGGSPLHKIIRRGKVSPNQVSVDGHLCWRVEVPARDDTTEKAYKTYSMWLDASIGYNPRRVEWRIKDELPKLPSTQITFMDYRNIGDGLWFPQRVQFVMTWPDGRAQRSSANMNSVEAGKLVAQSDVIVTFPKNTSVKDTIRHVTYSVP